MVAAIILSPSVTIRRDSLCGTLAPAEFGDSVKMMGTGKSAANAQNRTEVENPLITTSAQVYRVGGFPGEDLMRLLPGYGASTVLELRSIERHDGSAPS